MPSASTSLRVRYAETDRMGVVYYANYFVWFEVARAEGLVSLVSVPLVFGGLFLFTVVRFVVSAAGRGTDGGMAGGVPAPPASSEILSDLDTADRLCSIGRYALALGVVGASFGSAALAAGIVTSRIPFL